MQIKKVLYTKELRCVVSGFSYGSLGRLFLTSALFWTSPVYAAPTGGQVTSGAGAISQGSGTTTVNQASQNLSLNWQTFNVGAHESVNFVQPNATAIAVNRIADTSASQILGSLNANGQVFLINPNGIVFGAGSQVNVGGLVASTLNISDSDLAQATRHFSGGAAGTIVNQGTIEAARDGYVALLGQQVSNQGTIRAPGGTVALGAGSAVSLSFDASRLLSMQVDANKLNALAENKQLMVADGGQVLMSAGAKDSLLASVVNNTGVVQAQTVANHKGQIVLLAGMAAGTTEVGGTLDASAPNEGDGGFIETSAAHVHVTDAARITTRAAAGGKTGTWLIDPKDYTIAASGGDITGSTLSRNLGSSSVIIISSNGGTAGSGNINVNDAVNWSANLLTLTAANNININAVMTASGTSSLTLNMATANGADSAVTGGTVNAMPGVGRVDFPGLGAQRDAAGGAATLQGMAASANLTGHYALGTDIDASATSTWNSGAGFTPIGGNSTGDFTGVFNGLGHTISGLTIDSTEADVGFFGYVGTGATVQNVGLVGGSVKGSDTSALVGSLAGTNDGTVIRVYATGTVTGGDSTFVGGLVGTNCYCGTITQAYATGAVTGGPNSFAGGLVGYNVGSITGSYATGAVVAGDSATAGGLAGLSNATVTQAYATGAVTVGTSGYVGGLIGVNEDPITQSYATGAVNGGAGSEIGGLVGENNSAGSVSNSYWNSSTTGQTSGFGTNAGTFTATGLNAANAMTQASYAGWDFSTVWLNYDGHTHPLLRSWLTPLTITASNAVKTYDGVAYVGGNSVTYSSSPGSNLLGAATYGGTSQGAKNVGSYTIAPSGYWSNQQGYGVSYVNGGLTVNTATLIFTADSVSRPYGVANPVFTGTVTGFVGGDTLAGATTGTLVWNSIATANSPVGWYFIDGNGLSAMNYIFVQAPGNARALTVAPEDAQSWPAALLIASLQPADKPLRPLTDTTSHVVKIVGSGVRLP